MLQTKIVVGVIDQKEVNIRKLNGNIVIQMTDGVNFADYIRTTQGLALRKSTYTEQQNNCIYKSLMLNLAEIDKRCIELAEAEMNITYTTVLKTDGFVVKIGEGTEQQIFIVVEKQGKRALVQYLEKSITFISSTFTKEENVIVRNIIVQNMYQLVTKMRKLNMLQGNNEKAPHLYAVDDNNIETGLTEAGMRERTRIDRQLTSMFKTLENAGYNTLEIQALMMESILEVALQSRLAAKQNVRNVEVPVCNNQTNRSIRQVVQRNGAASNNCNV